MLTGVSKDGGRSAAAKRTAELIGCNYKIVEEIRKIRRDGTPEIQDDVRNGKIGINRAYNLVRVMEQGQDEEKRRKKHSAAQVKAVKSVQSEDNFAIVKEWGGDVGTHVNKAMEMYIRWLQDRERTDES